MCYNTEMKEQELNEIVAFAVELWSARQKEVVKYMHREIQVEDGAWEHRSTTLFRLFNPMPCPSVAAGIGKLNGCVFSRPTFYP